MAKRIRHINRNRNRITPTDRIMHVDTKPLSTYLREEKFKKVRIEPEDGLYLGGILFKGEAFLKPNGKYVTREKNITSNKYVDLIKKIPDTKKVFSRRTMSRKIKASLTTTRNKQINISEKLRIENKIKSNRGRNNKFSQKLVTRKIRK